jgi:tetratricopeptide (TPR) repeat protein
MGRGERVAIGIYLSLLGLFSLGVAEVVRFASFAGTPADLAYRLDRGEAIPSREEAALKALAERRSPPFPVVFALGRSARRLGEAEHATALLRQAAELNPTSSEALNELGNALFLVGDLDGAAESVDRAAQLASARPGVYWLSAARLHTFKAERETDTAAVAGHVERSEEAMRKVAAADPALAANARAVDHRANRFLFGPGLPTEVFLRLARTETDASAVEQQVRRRLFGQVPASLAPVLSALMVALMALFGLLGGWLRPSEPCGKCGRPVCRRCDPALPGGRLCGECVVAFSSHSAIEPSLRAAKEKTVRRHLRRREGAVKLAALIVAGAGHVLLGKTARGAALLLCFGFIGCLSIEHLLLHEGLARAPVGSAPLPLRAAPVLAALLALVAVSARSAFAHFRAASPVEHSLGD